MTIRITLAVILMACALLSASLWQHRMGHANLRLILLLVLSGLAFGIITSGI